MEMGKRVPLTKVSEFVKGEMKRVLTTSDVLAIGYGDLGSSIYYALGITALYALGATPIALAIAGLIFVCTALSYAEMSSMSVAAGGSASFIRYAMNDLVSFIAGWALLLDFIVTIAISAYSAIPYIAYFFPLIKNTQFQIAISIIVIGLLFIINLVGARHSTRLSWILTVLTIITQVVIVAIGAVLLVHIGPAIKHMAIGKKSLWSPSWLDFWKGTAMAMVAYTGIESMAQLFSETKNPTKTVPRAMMFATGILIVMYFGISIVALSAVTPQALSTTYLEDPVAGIVSALPIGQKFLGPWVGVLGAIILTVAANAGLVGASRLSFRMGEYHQLPRFLYKLNPHFKTPARALLLFAILASCIILWSRGKLNFLADLYNFGATLSFFSTHVALIVLRLKKPNHKRPFKIRGCIPFGKDRYVPITAIVGALSTFGVWISVVITKPEGRYLGFAWLAFGIIMYYINRRRENIAAVPTLKIEKIKIPDYTSFEFDHILVPTQGAHHAEAIQLACEIAKHHKAKLTVVNVIDIPIAISLYTPLKHKMEQAYMALSQAEAIASEYHIHIETKVVRARSISRAILALAQEGSYNLLVVSSRLSRNRILNVFSPITEEIVKNSPCQVIIACGKPHRGER